MARAAAAAAAAAGGENAQHQQAPPSPLAALSALAEEAERFVVYTPPLMDPSWHSAYSARLQDALCAALEAGGGGAASAAEQLGGGGDADGGNVGAAAASGAWLRRWRRRQRTRALAEAASAADLAFEALRRAARVLPDGAVPWPLLRRCVAAGLHADTDVGGGAPLLHFLLARPHPPPLAAADGCCCLPESEPSGANKAEAAPLPPSLLECPVTLQQLLATATPNLGDRRRGATALHVLCYCLADRAHFPPPADARRRRGGPGADRGGGGGSADADAEGPDDADAGADAEDARWRDCREFLAQAAADARRADYAAAAFEALLAAGWSAAGARDARGASARDLVAAGLRGARADLAEIADPAGLPRAALRQFVAHEGGGGAARLAELAGAHEAGAAAVVAAFERMSALAEAQRRPAAARFAAALVALWVLLIAIAWRQLVVVAGR